MNATLITAVLLMLSQNSFCMAATLMIYFSDMKNGLQFFLKIYVFFLKFAHCPTDDFSVYIEKLTAD